MPVALIHALAMIKAEAAVVNGSLGVIDGATGDAVRRAADEVAAGEWDQLFPVDVFQTGSGTSTNMNVNEVVASRAAELLGRDVHPNDHVNASQSSNDTIPTAIRVAAVVAVSNQLVPALQALAGSLRDLAAQHTGTVKMARTHLMDAVPMTFSQEVSGWARMVELGVDRLHATFGRVNELPIGGTAAGTGLNAPIGFGSAVAARLSDRTGATFREAVDHLEAQSAHDGLGELSAACRAVALSLNKIAGDLRLLGSGPAGGLAEIRLPELQKGSSIMPGKVNPVIPEVVQQVAAQVVGNDAAIVFAMTMSTLQLNTAAPVIARNLLSSIALTARAARLLDERCIAGIDVDVERMYALAARSSAIVTAIAPSIGYDAAAEIVRLAAADGVSIVDAARAVGVAQEHLDQLEDLRRMATPGQALSPAALVSPVAPRT